MGWIIVVIVLIVVIASVISKHSLRARKQRKDSFTYGQESGTDQNVPSYEELQEEFFDEFEQQ